MKTLKFIKGPGYLYDLLSLFVLYFNREKFLEEQVNQNKAAEDTEHFHQILNGVEKVPEELRVFFQLKEDHKTFLTTHYFHDKFEQILSDPGIDTVQTMLKNYDEVIKNVADFYFDTSSTDISFGSPDFLYTIGKQIRDSEYDVVLKNSLYEFFLDPMPVIQTLCNELAKKDIMLSKLYNENDATITKVQSKIDIDQLIKALLQPKETKLETSSINEVIISICVAHKNCSLLFTSESKIMILLGTDYEDFLNYMSTKGRTPELMHLGIALSEENRVQILELIYQNGEITVADIKKELHISHTNAYYHVTLLLKSNLLGFRNQGRTVYYNINHAYFEDICTILSKYMRKGGAEL